MDWVALLTGGAGGIFGIVGGLIQKWMDYKKEEQAQRNRIELIKLEHTQALAMQDKQLAYLQEEAKNAAVLATINAQKEVDVSSYQALAKSYEMDKRTYTEEGVEKKYQKWFVAVDFVRGMMRPVLTFLLDMAAVLLFVVCATILYKQYVSGILETTSFITAMQTAFNNAVRSILFLAELATGWWFAARGLGGRNVKD